MGSVKQQRLLKVTSLSSYRDNSFTVTNVMDIQHSYLHGKYFSQLTIEEVKLFLSKSLVNQITWLEMNILVSKTKGIFCT